MFKELLKAHTPSAFALSFRMLGCRESALEVVQESSLVLWQKRDGHVDTNDFRLYLFRVVHNKSIDHLRKRKVRQSERFDESTIIDENSPSPEQAYDDKKSRQVLNEALNQLSFEHRETLMLKDWQGLSYDEIAKVLGIERGTVMSRLHRARLKLAKYYEVHYPEGFKI